MIDHAFYGTWTPRTQALLRIVVAFLFLQHGTSKFFGFPQGGFEHLPPLIFAAGLLELVGGVLVLIGLLTRLAAFVLSGEMAFAYFIAHASQGNVLWPVLNHGEAAVLYCFVFLYFAAAGAGSWSVDALRSKAA